MTRHRREDVIEHAVRVLDAHGLADLTMRRLGRELDVQASAIYHHFENKQQLLAAVADAIIDGSDLLDSLVGDDWQADVRLVCTQLRDALLAHRDGAEVVATVFSFGLGAARPAALIRQALDAAGFDDNTALAGTDTLIHFVFGHAVDMQTQAQATELGADIGTRERGDFELGVGIILDGLSALGRDCRARS